MPPLPRWARALLPALMALLTVLALSTSAAAQGSGALTVPGAPGVCGAAGPSTCHTTSVATDEHAVVAHVRPELQRHQVAPTGHLPAPTRPAAVSLGELPGDSPLPLLIAGCSQRHTRAPPVSDE